MKAEHIGQIQRNCKIRTPEMELEVAAVEKVTRSRSLILPSAANFWTISSKSRNIKNILLDGPPLR